MRLDQFRLDNSTIVSDRYLKVIMEGKDCTIEEARKFYMEDLKHIQKLQEEGYTQEEAVKIQGEKDPVFKKYIDVIYK